MDIRVYPNAAAAARVVADFIASEVSESARTVGLAGGGTPRAAYALLPAYALDWSTTTLWLGDERWVAATDPASNGRMVHETITTATGASLIAPDFTLGDPTAAAAAYSIALESAFGGEDPGLICLGLGEDGHTASLFPGTSALSATGTYAANHVQQLDTWRLTATFDLLWRARTLLFVVTGATKAPVLAAIAAGDRDYPAGHAAAGAREAIWIVDAAAADDL